MEVRTELATCHRHCVCVEWMVVLKLGTAWKVNPPKDRPRNVQGALFLTECSVMAGRVLVTLGNSVSCSKAKYWLTLCN